MRIQTMSIVAGTTACNARCAFCISRQSPTCGIESNFAPLISDEDFEMINSGKMPNKSDYNKWYVQDAVKAWWLKNGIKS